MINRYITMISDFLLALPSEQKRPHKAFWLNAFAVGEYDPSVIETYALFLAVRLGLILNAFCMAYFALPLFFKIPQGILNPDPAAPVSYFKDHYTFYVLPCITALCVSYALAYLYLHRTYHAWDFANYNKKYMKNMNRFLSLKFGPVRFITLHIFVMFVGFTLIFYSKYFIDFIGSYRLMQSIHNFSDQTFENFLFIALVFMISFLVSYSDLIMRAGINLSQVLMNKHAYFNIYTQPHIKGKK